MDIDFKTFIVRYMYDIVFILVVGGKLILQGTTDLRSKLLGLVFLGCAIFMLRLLTAKYIGPDIPAGWYVLVMIGTRLIALKLIYSVIDYDE